MTIRCESDDGRMAKTGDLLDCADGELREELECESCGERSAIYYTRDGQELLEEGAYSDRDLEVELEGSDRTVEWEGGLSHNSWASSYDREARGTVEIDGPGGTLVAVRTFRAMLDDDNDLMDAGQIDEYVQYFRADESEPFADYNSEWDVPVDVLESPQEFLAQCGEAAEADPQVEYEQRAEDL